MPFAEIDHVLIFFSIFLCFYAGVRRSLSIVSTLGAFAAACIFTFLDLHNELGTLWSGKEGNPQKLTVLLMLSSWSFLAVTLFKKSRRTIDRIMVAIAGASVILTFALFHTVMVHTILPAWSKDAAWGNSFLVSVPKVEFEDACEAARLVCWTREDIEAESLPASYLHNVIGIHSFYLANPTEDEVGHGFGVFNDLGTDGVAAVLYHQRGQDVRVIADAKTGVRIHSTVRDMFYLLTTVAHSVWLFGALSLIAFHRRRFKARQA